MAGAITVLNSVSLVSLVILMITGRWVGMLEGIHHPTAALVTMLLVMVTEITAMFYLMGVGKEIREKVRAHGLDPGLHGQAVAYRKRVLTPALYSLLALMGGAITGAAADTRVLDSGMHGVTALLLFGIVLTSAVIQERFVKRNAALLEEVRELAAVSSGPNGQGMPAKVTT